MPFREINVQETIEKECGKDPEFKKAWESRYKIDETKGKILTALYDQDINFNGTQYKIMLCLLDNADILANGSEMSLGELAKFLRKSKKQIQRELNVLIKLNVIKIVETYSCEERYGRTLTLNEPALWTA